MSERLMKKITLIFSVVTKGGAATEGWLWMVRRAFPGFFQAFSRAGAPCSRPGVCWSSSSPTVTHKWLRGRHMKGTGQLSPGDAPALAPGPGCHCSATGAAAAVVRLAQPLLQYAQGHTHTPRLAGYSSSRKTAGPEPGRH